MPNNSPDIEREAQTVDVEVIDESSQGLFDNASIIAMFDYCLNQQQIERTQGEKATGEYIDFE